MRTKSIVYPVLLLYELLKLYLLLKLSVFSGNVEMSLGWFAGIGLLSLVPILFFMLYLDEAQFHLWLPLLALIKALGIPGLVVFLITTTPTAVRFVSSENLNLLESIAASAFFIVFDAVIGLFCFRRSRLICK